MKLLIIKIISIVCGLWLFFTLSIEINNYFDISTNPEEVEINKERSISNQFSIIRNYSISRENQLEIIKLKIIVDSLKLVIVKLEK